MAERWIQRAIKREGRVRRYLKRVYGNKAFTRKGQIKYKYPYNKRSVHLSS